MRRDTKLPPFPNNQVDAIEHTIQNWLSRIFLLIKGYIQFEKHNAKLKAVDMYDAKQLFDKNPNTELLGNMHYFTIKGEEFQQLRAACKAQKVTITSALSSCVSHAFAAIALEKRIEQTTGRYIIPRIAQNARTLFSKDVIGNELSYYVNSIALPGIDYAKLPSNYLQSDDSTIKQMLNETAVHIDANLKQELSNTESLHSSSLLRHYAVDIATKSLKNKQLGMKTFAISNIGDQSETATQAKDCDKYCYKISDMLFFASVTWAAPLVSVLSINGTMKVVLSFPEPLVNAADQSKLVASIRKNVSLFFESK